MQTTAYNEKEAKKTNKRQIVNRDAAGRIRSLREPYGVYQGTREQWLNEASNIMSVWINDTITDKLFSDDPKTVKRFSEMTLYKPHQVEYACSLLSGGMTLTAELAHCHKMGNTYEIRMGVQLEGQTDFETARVADILLHEMCHVCTWGNGHGVLFKTLAQSVGLTGKMTSTVATDDLTARILEEIVYVLGKYPHKLSFDHSDDTVNAPELPSGKKLLPRGKGGKGSRLLKVCCIECGMNFRTTGKWITLAGDEGFRCPIINCGGLCVIG